MYTKATIVFIGIISLIGIYFPSRHAIRYRYIKDENILSELEAQNSLHTEYNLKNCDYKNLIYNSYDFEIKDIYLQKNFIKPNKGTDLTFKCFFVCL